MSTSWSAVNSPASAALRRTVLAFTPLLFLAGCASRADLDQVRQSQREVRRLLANYTVALEDVRRRMDQLQSLPAGPGRVAADNDLRRRIERLEARSAPAGTATAPGTVPEVAPPPTGDNVAAPWPGQPAAAPEVPVPPMGSVAAPAVAPIDADEAAATDPAYKAALDLVRQGQCREAIPALRAFIRKSPKSPSADNAQYQIGSCYYGQKDYNRAIVELNEVLLKYPKADKVPAALLMLADSFADSGGKIDARLILQKLITDYPESPEAQQGKQKLQSLSE